MVGREYENPTETEVAAVTVRQPAAFTEGGHDTLSEGAPSPTFDDAGLGSAGPHGGEVGQEGLPMYPFAAGEQLEERVKSLEGTIRHLLALLEVVGSTVSSRARALAEEPSTAERYASSTTSRT